MDRKTAMGQNPQTENRLFDLRVLLVGAFAFHLGCVSTA